MHDKYVGRAELQNLIETHRVWAVIDCHHLGFKLLEPQAHTVLGKIERWDSDLRKLTHGSLGPTQLKMEAKRGQLMVSCDALDFRI